MHTLTRNFFKGEGGRLQVHEDLIIIERVKTTLCEWGGGGLGNKKKHVL